MATGPPTPSLRVIIEFVPDKICPQLRLALSHSCTINRLLGPKSRPLTLSLSRWLPLGAAAADRPILAARKLLLARPLALPISPRPLALQPSGANFARKSRSHFYDLIWFDLCKLLLGSAQLLARLRLALLSQLDSLRLACLVQRDQTDLSAPAEPPPCKLDPLTNLGSGLALGAAVRVWRHPISATCRSCWAAL